MTPYEIAQQELGTTESHDPTYSNPRIIEYDATTTLRATDDHVAWCSAFMNWCVRKSGLSGTNSAAARSWLNWGEPALEPKEGDIIILQRGEYPSAHVGFFVEKRDNLIKVLGGNQKSTVEYDWFKDDGVLGYRSISS